jgi:hypothetical protein
LDHEEHEGFEKHGCDPAVTFSGEVGVRGTPYFIIGFLRVPS